MANNIMPVSFDYTILNATPVTPTPIQSLFDDVETLFVDWLQKQPSQRQSSIALPTAKHYAQELKPTGDPRFDVIVGKNLFTVVDQSEYEQLYTSIKQHSDFVAYNQARGNGYFSASLDYYRTFLADSEIRRTLKMMIATAPILAAIRTKPFLLLAGISGTGKTRLVRQLARGCCHEPKLVSKETNTCGNYECIPVRPNWHDSTELLGYVTRITKNDEPPKYVMTPFVEFLAKAWTYRETPFFLCLDEMNLAPVEQYFAEYLSVVESRDRITVGDGADAFECISSREKLVRFDALEKETKDGLLKELFDNKDWEKNAQPGRVQQVKAMFEKDGGIRLPPNLVVMGTVNMDETTCTFSRKVLDRAMSFELNNVDMDEGLDKTNETDFDSIAVEAATPRLLNGHDAWTENQPLCEKVKAYLVAVNNNDNLGKTPFKIAYRSRDEIMVYCLERTKGREDMLAQALDEATSMKILSRIEGDENRFKTFSLVKFQETVALELLKVDNPAATGADAKKKIADDKAVVDPAKRSPSLSKLGKMIGDLETIGAVSFWD